MPVASRPALAAVFVLAALTSAQSPPATKGEPDPFKPTDPTAAEAVLWLDARAAESKFPLAFDAARARVVRDAALAWYRRSTVEAFEKTGKTTAPWADKAKAALDAWARDRAANQVSHANDRVLEEAVRKTVRAAVDAGCDDPMIRYIWLKVRGRDGDDDDGGEFLRTATALYQSGYPDVRKVHAAYNAGADLRDRGDHLTAAEKKGVKVWDMRFWELFDKVCADPDPHTQGDVADICRLLMTSGRAKFEEIAARLEQAKAPAYTRNLVKGRYLIKHAWEARGSGVASTVTEQGWKDFHERLEGSKAALTAAWEADNLRPEAPTEMITVCLGLTGERSEMEAWFARAMAANPDNVLACTHKLYYLLPKWHGSMEEYLGFGWQCVRTGNSAGAVTWAAVAGHMSEAPIFDRSPEIDPDGLRKYYGHVAVWQQVDTACRLRLADRPDDLHIRCVYARLATIAGRYDVAVREFETIGDGFARTAFPTRKEYDWYRKWAKDKTPPPVSTR